MIEELYKVPSLDKENISTLQRSLANLHERSAGITYTETVPTVDTVPSGGIVVYDDGLGDMRLYVRTGKGNIGYIALS